MKTILRAVLLSTLFTTFSFADIINVPADTSSIQGGIDLANDGDTVLVDVGTYYENINFDGKKITVGSLYLTTNDKSYISKTVIDGNQESSVVRFIESDSTAVLCGFTITNGLGGSGGAAFHTVFWAGGITCGSSNPTLSNLKITKNNGGGVLLQNSNPRFISVTVTENSADVGGGIHFGINSWDRTSVSKPTFDSVNRCNIFSNYATKGSDLYSSNDTLSINVVVDTFTVLNPTDFHVYRKEKFNIDMMNPKVEQSNSDLYVSPDGNNNNSGLTKDEPLKAISFAFMKIMADSINPRIIYLANGDYNDELINGGSIGLPDYVSMSGESNSGVIFNIENYGQASFSGQGIFSFNSSKGVSIENMTIIGNGETIGILCNNSDPVIINVILNGARIRLWGSSPHIEKVKISGNLHEAPIFIQDGSPTLSSPTLINVEITDNSGWLTGGLRCDGDSYVNLINCTISNNKSGTDNVGVITGGLINIVNSIIWENLPNNIPASGNVLYSDIQGGWSGEGNINADPMFLDDTNGDYSLQAGSPCIDAGIQDTFLVYNDGQDTLYIPPMDYMGSAPDIGAYEFDPATNINEKYNIPFEYSLKQNYPNPFNPSTTIEFSIPKSEFVTLIIYNLLGQEVEELVAERLKTGNYTYSWNAGSLSSGVYIYRIQAGAFQEVRKMIYLK